MEKTLKLTWTEILKWLTFIALLISSFVANQVDISYLKKENKDRRDEIKEIRQEQKEAGEQAASVNGKLTQISDDVTLIKDAIISSQLNPHR